MKLNIFLLLIRVNLILIIPAGGRFILVTAFFNAQSIFLYVILLLHSFMRRALGGPIYQHTSD